MKKTILALLTALQSIYLIAAPTKTIPIDPDLRRGTLENGFTYYVRHNEEPKGEVCMHLVWNVGSIVEEEHEQGLAHFLEHMCFNGSEHFPGNSLVSFLETRGAKFGYDINAYTAMDETIYSIDNIYTERETLVDSCLLIIRDWCDGLLLEDEEIDLERGVIKEEWRSTRGAQRRMMEAILPTIYHDSCLYGRRLPIGKLEVIENFKPQTIRDYYRKWSRPELQAIVVVGDVDADKMVEKIRRTFSDMKPSPAGLPERINPPVPDNDTIPVVAFAHDKEQEVPTIYLYKKQSTTPAKDRVDEDYMWMLYIQEMMDMMIGQRLSAMKNSGDCEWIDAAIGETDFYLSKTKGAWMGVLACEPEKAEQATAALYREMKRIELHGFTQAEYDAARKEYLSYLTRQYNEREKISSVTYCKRFDRNYIDNDPIPSEEQKLALIKEISDAVDLSFINFYCRLMPKANWTIIGMLPDGMQEPDLVSAIDSVENEDIEPYEEPAPIKPLMEQIPAPGTSRKAGKGLYGYERYKLSNGATVYIKGTDINPNQIQIRAFSAGGTSIYPDDDLAEIKSLDDLLLLGGLGELSSTELSRSLTGKQVSFTPEIGSMSEGVYGASTIDDFETLLQLTHLFFTAQRRDTTAFNSYIARSKAALRNADVSPQTALNDTINKVVVNNFPRTTRVTLEDLDALRYGRAKDMAAERFANAADFTFIFTGHFDREKMMPLIERYIGGLPAAKGRKETYIDRGRRISEGRLDNTFERPMETEMAAAVRIYHTGGRYNLRNNIAYDMMGRCLGIILHEEIREKMGGTYSITAKASFNADPIPVRSLQTVYQTDPAKREAIDARIDEILRDFALNGPSDEVFEQVREAKLKSYKENRNTNAWYSTLLREYIETGVDFGTRYVKALDSITKKDLAAQLSALLRSGNEIRITMVGVTD